MIYFTSVCANYLPKAMALASSVKRHCKDATFVLCLVEREIPDVAAGFADFDHVILAKDAGWEDFEQFIFRHSIVEASTAVKPRFMIHLMERFGEASKFVYLDPDVLVYSDFVELDALLDEHSIVLCPHLLRPGNIDMEISSLAHGAYNLGFLAVARSENASHFLKWWADRLFLFCYDDKSRGIFTDQKWIDLVPCFFEAHVLKHHGYDFATWSLLGSRVERTDEGYLVNGDPLRFVHFSGIDSGMIDRAIGWWLTPESGNLFPELYAEYKRLLDQLGQRELGARPWSYDYFRTGERISKEARNAYRDRALWTLVPRPFDSSNEEILGHVPGLPRLSLVRRIARSVAEVGVRATAASAVARMTSKKAGRDGS